MSSDIFFNVSNSPLFGGNKKAGNYSHIILSHYIRGEIRNEVSITPRVGKEEHSPSQLQDGIKGMESPTSVLSLRVDEKEINFSFPNLYLSISG